MSASTNSAGPPLPARMVVEGEYLEKNWKKWRQLWEASAAAAQLGKQDKAVQVGTLTLALGHDALDLLNSLPYGSEEDKEDPAKVLELMEKR